MVSDKLTSVICTASQLGVHSISVARKVDHVTLGDDGGIPLAQGSLSCMCSQLEVINLCTAYVGYRDVHVVDGCLK